MDTKITLMLDFSKINKLSPKKGRILISEPFLNDEHFKRSIILLCECNQEGAFGFILNNLMKIELNELIEGIEVNGFNMSLGGPVQTSNLYYVHTLANELPGSTEIMPGLWVGGDFEVLKKRILLNQITDTQIRFFLGYSGWSPNQLEEEMNQGAWFVSELAAKEVMNANKKKSWNEVLSKMGGKFGIISNFPENPELN